MENQNKGRLANDENYSAQGVSSQNFQNGDVDDVTLGGLNQKVQSGGEAPPAPTFSDQNQVQRSAESQFQNQPQGNQSGEQSGQGVVQQQSYNQSQNNQVSYEAQGLPGESLTEKQKRVGVAWGVASIIVGVLSFFIVPIVLAPAGIIMGIVAKNKGARSFGIAGIGLSIFFLLVTIIFNSISIMREGVGAPDGLIIKSLFGLF